MIANRFQRVLNDCIDGSQNAFVPSQLISNNILLAFEILHTFGWSKGGTNYSMVLKLDTSKAYDRVK